MQVVRLDPDQSGNIWVATGNGLTKISGVSGINDEENIKISISPNPATDFVSITTDETPSQISILNITGQVVQTINPVSAQTNIATNQLPSGVYFVKVNSNNRIITRKFIIE
ncbi:hypothetical protein SDC9_106535 [bioreactor metagenome]|uniref:Secretion system C-terminal sorting domain-containing protein n=1 Tax=bioreactor metagenome TaxID=1076179 RepID=A0A645B2P7_9ZZZZ